MLKKSLFGKNDLRFWPFSIFHPTYSQKKNSKKTALVTLNHDSFHASKKLEDVLTLHNNKLDDTFLAHMHLFKNMAYVVKYG